LGATVWIAAEDMGDQAAAQLLTNQRGSFSSSQMRPGLYSVRVSLVGFLPALERHVRITPNLTTIVKIELGTVFDTLDSLRRAPVVPTDSDDWKWVLRTSAATRPVLQWQDAPLVVVGPEAGHRGRSSEILVDMTSGSLHPGSPSNEGDAPGTGVSYEVPLGPAGKLLVAGQMSYDGEPAGGVATIWLPSGDINVGPVTTLVIRESAPGSAGVSFYGMRLAHSERFNFGSSVRAQVGAEYVSEGLAGARHTSILPSAEADVRLSDEYTLSALLATDSPSSDPFHADALRSVLDAMDSLPIALFNNGRPVLDENLHAELRLARRLGNRASLEAAVFHDNDPHQAVFGIGSAPIADAVEDPFSNAFVYDGGRLSTWGARGVYNLKVSDNLDFAALYAFAGALALDGGCIRTSRFAPGIRPEVPPVRRGARLKQSAATRNAGGRKLQVGFRRYVDPRRCIWRRDLPDGPQPEPFDPPAAAWIPDESPLGGSRRFWQFTRSRLHPSRGPGRPSAAGADCAVLPGWVKLRVLKVSDLPKLESRLQ
jgi:hypothetical protein